MPDDYKSNLIPDPAGRIQEDLRAMLVPSEAAIRAFAQKLRAMHGSKLAQIIDEEQELQQALIEQFTSLRAMTGEPTLLAGSSPDYFDYIATQLQQRKEE